MECAHLKQRVPGTGKIKGAGWDRGPVWLGATLVIQAGRACYHAGPQSPGTEAPGQENTQNLQKRACRLRKF